MEKKDIKLGIKVKIPMDGRYQNTHNEIKKAGYDKDYLIIKGDISSSNNIGASYDWEDKRFLVCNSFLAKDLEPYDEIESLYQIY